MKKHRILIPLDGSAAAEAALPEAERITLSRAETYFLHAVPSLPLSEASVIPGIMGLHDQALSYLDNVRKRFPRLVGLDIIRTDDPSGAICRGAREFDIDLIVMVTHGRDGMSNWPMGPVSDTVVRETGIPVLLVHPGRPAPSAPIRRILVAMDGSTASLAIQEVTSRIANLTGADVVFLHINNPAAAHVSAPAGSGASWKSETQDEKYEDFRNRVSRAGHEYSEVQVEGNPIQVILNEADTLDVDLIAMSTGDWQARGSKGLANIAQAILGLAGRPVLLQVAAADESGPGLE